ncbi:MAG: ShlB/FhaC/HecB family hemolysin secretion/activation protein [Rhodocyclaceae bacterium]|nr:ShlB/FhaC/HecB family hemolysin secretion/activation protein [Rhodocyclaceae bacterium]
MPFLRVVLAGCGLALPLCSAHGENPSFDPHFAVAEYRVEGATLVDRARINDALAGFTGPDQSFDSLRKAVEAVEAVYHAAGYPAVRVQLPEQEIDSGVVLLRVIEARLSFLQVEGNQHFSDQNILASVPGLVPGQPPSVARVEASLALANESFAKRARLSFAQGEQEGAVVARIQVADERPWRVIAFADNTGTAATGRHRLGLIGQHANLFDLDHAMTAMYVTSPEKPSQVNIYNVGYKIPIYRWGDSVEFTYTHSNVDSGTVDAAGASLAISGRGSTTSLRYNLGLNRWNGREQRLSLGLDHQIVDSRATPVGGGGSVLPTPRVTATPLSLTYTLSSPEGQNNWHTSLGALQNIPVGRNGDSETYNGSRAGANVRFLVWRWALGGSVALGEWNLKGELAGQETHDRLVSFEQFGLGGADSVRGFNEREIANDRGHRGSVELATPAREFVSGWRGNLVGFYDFGRLYANNPQPTDASVREGIASAGAGLRLVAGRGLFLKADLARVLVGGGSKVPGDLSAHVSLIALF